MPDTTVRTVLASGQSIPCHAGRFTVTMSSPRESIYRVAVAYGGPAGADVPELSGSYESLALARGIARVLVKALQADNSTVESARAAVADWLDAQMAFITADDRIVAAETAAHLQRIKARFESADEAAWSAALIARINATLDARPAVA